VYVTEILSDPLWDNYRESVLPYGIWSAWSRPLFTSEGAVLGSFAILYREVRSPSTTDLQWIENASQIAGIAIERHIREQELRHERDRLHLLPEIANSVTAKLDLRGLIEVLSASLLGVTRSDFCALLLPDADSGQLRVTVLYNPQAQGSIGEGAMVPINGSIGGKAFRTGKGQRINSFEDENHDPESFGNEEGQRFFECVRAKD